MILKVGTVGHGPSCPCLTLGEDRHAANTMTSVRALVCAHVCACVQVFRGLWDYSKGPLGPMTSLLPSTAFPALHLSLNVDPEGRGKMPAARRKSKSKVSGSSSFQE